MKAQLNCLIYHNQRVVGLDRFNHREFKRCVFDTHTYILRIQFLAAALGWSGRNVCQPVAEQVVAVVQMKGKALFDARKKKDSVSPCKLLESPYLSVGFVNWESEEKKEREKRLRQSNSRKFWSLQGCRGSCYLSVQPAKVSMFKYF